MAEQLDMFALASPPPPAAPRPAPVMIIAPPKPARPAPAQETLNAMSAVTLLRESGEGRVVVGHTGWGIAMARRELLVRAQMDGTLDEGERLALTALSRLHVMEVGRDASGVFVPLDELESYDDALAGMLCLAAAAVQDECR